MLTPASKNSDYSGPVYHKTIIDQIYREAQKQGRDISPQIINGVIISLFYKSIGIPSYIKKGKNVFISGFGRFAVTSSLKKNLELIREKRKIRRKKTVAKILKKHCHKIKLLDKTRKHLPIFDELNYQYRVKGWREWTWRQYCSINKMTTCIPLYDQVRAEEQKKIDLMKNGIFQKGDLVRTKDGKTMIFYCNYGNVINGYKRPRMTCFVCPVTKENKPNMRYWGNGELMSVVFNDELFPCKP